MANHAVVYATKYLTAPIIITVLLLAETNAQLLHVNLLSFNNNRAGDNSLNNNGNAAAGGNAGRLDQGVNPTVQIQNPFSSWPSAVGTGLGLITGTLFDRSFSYPSYVYYTGYPYYGGYRPTYYYYRNYPSYYYYYRG